MPASTVNMAAIDVAIDVFGRDVSWLYKNRTLLETRLGFPKPLPRLRPGDRYVWRRRDVEAWLERRSAPIESPANDTGTDTRPAGAGPEDRSDLARRIAAF